LPAVQVATALPVDSLSASFLAKLPLLDSKIWQSKARFTGSFHQDSAMQVIFGKNCFRFACDYFGNEDDTKTLFMGIWKTENYPAKTFASLWEENQDTFPNPRNKINDTRANGDSIFEIGTKKYAILSTSTLSSSFPEFSRTGRFQAAFLGIALFEQKNIDNILFWELQFYTPAIGLYGSYSTAPSPTYYLFGKKEIVLAIQQSNGGAGGPFYSQVYLHKLSNTSPLLLEEHFIARFYEQDGKGEWKTELSFAEMTDQEFPNLVLTTKGNFSKNSFTKSEENIETIGFPKSLEEKIKQQDDFDFTLIRTYQIQDNKYSLVGEVLE
jgi:hypothetical protein